MPASAPHLKKLFNEILKNFTLVPESSFGTIYIKHLNNFDLAEIDSWYNFYLQKCINKKIPTLQEKLDYLISNNLWTQNEETKLKEYLDLKKQYENNRDNEYLKSKRQIWADQIKIIEKDIKLLEYKKNSQIGDTAESFAIRKSNKLHIIYSFFIDPELKSPLFNEEKFDDLEKDKIEEIYGIFNDYLSNFNQENLKRISLSPFFMNMFGLANDNIYYFYGKPIIYLSFYQIDTWAHGRYFKNVLSEFMDKIPRDYLDDPDKIIEFVELNKNYRKMFPEDKDEGAGTIVGAKKEDLEILGLKATGNKQLQDMLKKSGGHIGKDELMKMM